MYVYVYYVTTVKFYSIMLFVGFMMYVL